MTSCRAYGKELGLYGPLFVSLKGLFSIVSVIQVNYGRLSFDGKVQFLTEIQTIFVQIWFRTKDLFKKTSNQNNIFCLFAFPSKRFKQQQQQTKSRERFRINTRGK